MRRDPGPSIAGESARQRRPPQCAAPARGPPAATRRRASRFSRHMRNVRNAPKVADEMDVACRLLVAQRQRCFPMRGPVPRGSQSGAAPGALLRSRSRSRCSSVSWRVGIASAAFLGLAPVAFDRAQLPPAKRQHTTEHKHALDQDDRPVRPVHRRSAQRALGGLALEQLQHPGHALVQRARGHAARHGRDLGCGGRRFDQAGHCRQRRQRGGGVARGR